MDPFDLLLQSSGSQVAPETLEMLAHKASQLYQQQGMPLNQAILQVTANNPQLSNEHLKRIVEFANTVTFQELFQLSEDKNVHFDVADPGVVMRDLKDGGSPAHDGKPMSTSFDYLSPPQSQQGGMGDLEQMFGAQSSDIAKTASVSHLSHANPVDDVYDVYSRLTASREKLASNYEEMSMILEQTKEDLSREVKNEILFSDGAGLGGVISAMQKVASDEELEALLLPMIEKLSQDYTFKTQATRTLEKKAGAVVNPNHPIVVQTAAIVKLAHEMAAVSDAIDKLDENIDMAKGVIKQAGRLATGIKHVVGVKGKVPAGLRQRSPKL